MSVNPAPGAVASRHVRFIYDSNDRITDIVDHAGRVWRYSYDDWGDLIAFTSPAPDDYAEGLTERYSYSTAFSTGELQHKLILVEDTAAERTWRLSMALIRVA